MKKILNVTKAIALIAIGILFLYLNFIKWVPFDNYLTNNIAGAINFVWAYFSVILGLVFTGVGISSIILL